MNLRAIPFDSLVLWRFSEEAQRVVGGYVHRIWQSDAWTLVIRFRKSGSEENLLVSCDPRFPRVHFVKNRPTAGDWKFARVLKAKLENAKVVGVETVGFDRVLSIRFEKGGKVLNLVALLFGSHSNVVLTSNTGRIEALVRKTKGLRVSHALQLPVAPASSVEEALSTRKGLSRFLAEVVESLGSEETWKQIVNGQQIYVPGNGVYPFYPSCFSFENVEYPSSLSEALEKHYANVVSAARTDSKRYTLRTHLDRMLDSHNAALKQMEAILHDAYHAKQLQNQGELLLAHLNSIADGARIFEVEDEEGNLISIRLDPTKTALENAQRLFEKSKRAKKASQEVSRQYSRMRDERDLILKVRQQLESADDVLLNEIENVARQKGWLKSQTIRENQSDKRQYEGYRIRELEAPGGFKIIVGENAAANDYIVSRIAKPNDYWFHVRGATGSHVVLQTNNKPERVQRETLEFVARIAAKHSSQKHAKWVSVAYTLMKYVRKPRKSAPGTVVYSHEKTIQLNTTE